ncbi:MAG: acyltransferase [Anaerolineae bacterium]
MTASLPISKSRHIPGLHTLRVYAALSVVVGHVDQFIPGWFLIDVNTGILRNLTLTGGGAVLLFYVLSGYLLTTALLAEKRQRTDVDAGRFYRRRLRRIVPAYYLVMAVTVVVSVLTAPNYGIVFGRQFDALQIPATLLFATFVPLALNSVSGMFSHLWSVGVEIVFYGMVPWLVRSRYVPLTFGLVIALRLLLLAVLPVDSPLYQIVLYLKIDALAIGGLFALLWQYQQNAVKRTLTTRPARLVLILLLALLIVGDIPAHVVPVDFAMAFIFGWLILNINAGYFVFENRLVLWLGNLTFGIYLWHMLALFIVGASGMAGVRVYVAVFGIALALAYVTYNLVERPIMGDRRPQTALPVKTLPGGIEEA